MILYTLNITTAQADQVRWAIPNEGMDARDGDARVRAWCEVNNARCDGDAFGMAFSDLKGAQPSLEIAAMRGSLFNSIMTETCYLHGLWQEPSKAELHALRRRRTTPANRAAKARPTLGLIASPVSRAVR